MDCDHEPVTEAHVRVSTFLGTVYPPHAALRGGHVRTSQRIQADVASRGTDLSRGVRAELPRRAGLHLGHLGRGAHRHRDHARPPHGDLHDREFGIEDNVLREAVRRALVETQSGHIRVALADISAALRHPQDTAMHCCYRAIESAHKYFVAATSSDPAWEVMRVRLGRAFAGSRQVPANDRRHVAARVDVTAEDRRDFISVARLVTWRLSREVLTEQQRGDLLEPIGTWQPELTSAMASLASAT